MHILLPSATDEGLNSQRKGLTAHWLNSHVSTQIIVASTVDSTIG